MTTDTKTDTPISLLKQRELLRLEMRIQRQVIAQQLGPDPEENSGYPRSKTMRFLQQRPGLVTKLALELATVFVGASFIKSFSTAVGFARMLR
ncbi:MAG: hypothetical protein ACREO1_01140 [Arenimonas sp.]